MPFKNSFDETLGRYRGVPDGVVIGDVGIEIELEGNLKPINNQFWKTKPDGSLREGGQEYVFKVPAPINDVPMYLEYFTKAMAASEPHASIRCSTHMHINVNGFTLREIYNVMAAYYLVESLLVATQSENRQGNLFCLRMQDAEDIFLSIKDSLERNEYVHQFIVERNRYAALNLNALSKFGSLEFRFLDAITTAKGLQAWANIFYHLVHNSRRINPQRLLSQYDELSPVDFLYTLMPKEGVDQITKGLSEGQINRLLHTNYDYVFELCELLRTKRYQLPKSLWNEDLEDEKLSRPGKKYSFAPGFASLPPQAFPPAPNPWGDMTATEQAALISMTQATNPGATWSTAGGHPVPPEPVPIHIIDDFGDEPQFEPDDPDENNF